MKSLLLLLFLTLSISSIHSQTLIESCGDLEIQDTGVYVVSQNIGIISRANRETGFLALNNVDYGFLADGNETGYYAFGNNEGYKAFQNFSHGVTSNDNFGDGIHCELAWGHGGYFATRSLSSKPAVYIEHGDDAKIDLSLEGIGHLAVDSNFVVHLNNSDTLPGGTTFQVLNGGDSAIMTLTEAGDATFIGQVCGSLVTTCSDERYKKLITPLSNSLSKVLSIEGVTYHWDRERFPNRFDDTKQIGFIAQDLEATLPELVRTDAQGYKSVAYDKMTAVLVEAVKELKAENDSLRAETDDLKAQLSRLDELEARLEAMASAPKGL